jgi:hypothetical protein
MGSQRTIRFELTLPFIIHHLIMFFSTFFTTVLLATASIAAPINRPQKLVVFNPHIISPAADVLWPMGSNQTVRWSERHFR